MEERANPKHAFDFVLDTFERKCDFSTVSMTSDFRERNITDARMVFYKILRDTFKLSYTSIGALFNKNHSTIISAMKQHDRLYTRDKGYTKMCDAICVDVALRMKLQHLYNMRNNAIKLKMLYINEKETCNVLIKCFESKSESLKYMRENGVLHDSVIFNGQPEMISSTIANEVVNSDEKRYMIDLMKRNTDPIMSLLNEPIDRYYMNYSNGLYEIKNDPMLSLTTAFEMFDHKDVALIHISSAL
jgi:hypothetical protein